MKVRETLRVGVGRITVETFKPMFRAPLVNLNLLRTDGPQPIQLWMHLDKQNVTELIEMLSAARNEL